MSSTPLLTALQQVIDSRRNERAESSYVASLHQKGLNKILEKVAEEATETLLAAKDAERGGELTPLVKETADLWFHSLVLLSHFGLSHQHVLDELQARFGVSGHDEKASRAAGANPAQAK